jgi:hypothetical protein
MSTVHFRAALLTAHLGIIAAVAPRPSAAQPTLTVERIFSAEFQPQAVRRSRWLDDSTYTMLDQKESSGGSDLVRVDAASGRRSVLIPAIRFRPRAPRIRSTSKTTVGPTTRRSSSSSPTRRAWRENTRGDFGCSTSRPDR